MLTVGTKIIDLGMDDLEQLWTAKMHSVAEKLRH